MNRKPNAWESFLNFISGKGFYLVVLLCVAAIGVSGYYLARSLTGTEEEATTAVVGSTQLPDESAAAISRAPASVPPAPSTAVTETSPAPALRSDPAASPSPTATAEAPAAVESTEPSPSQTPASGVFTWPVSGTVITAHSVETLLYDVTMRDWRTHEGIDVAADEGTQVLAAAGGTVSQCYADELMGTTVVIDHGQGLSSVYANLSAEVAVAEGDAVYAGDVIGTVGATAAAESGREPHLHFAMYQDGAAVDPEEFLPR